MAGQFQGPELYSSISEQCKGDLANNFRGWKKKEDFIFRDV